MNLTKRSIIALLLLMLIPVCLTSCQTEEKRATEKLNDLISDYSYYVSKANSMTELREIAKKRLEPIEKMRDVTTPLSDWSREVIANKVYITLLDVSRRIYELNGNSELLDKGSLPSLIQEELRARTDSLIVRCETIGQVAEALITDNAEITK